MSFFSVLVKKQKLIYFVVAVFSLFTLSGCSSGNQTQVSQKPKIEISNFKYFSASEQNVNRAVEKVLYNNGYVVISHDSRAGIITAEHYTTSPIEDVETIAPTAPNTGEVIFTILSIIFIVGIIFIIIDASSSKDKKKDNNHDDHHSENHESSKTYTYKYVMSLHTSAITDTSTKIEVNYTKITIVDGSPSSSVPVNCNSVMKIFFESLENELYFMRK